MRVGWTWLAVVAAGCGRIGFDPLAPDGGPVIRDFADFAACPFVVNGTATCMGGRLRLTPALTDYVAGSAFLPEPFALSPTTSVHTQFSFVITGGDGMTFVVQNSPDGASALGWTGGALGYGGNDIDPRVVGIAPSVAAEVDTTENVTLGDVGGNHIAFDVDGKLDVPLGMIGAPFSVSSGLPGFVWIDYDAQTRELTMALASEPVQPAPLLVRTVDFFATVGSRAYVGFTAANGVNDGDQEVLSWTLALEP